MQAYIGRLDMSVSELEDYERSWLFYLRATDGADALAKLRKEAEAYAASLQHGSRIFDESDWLDVEASVYSIPESENIASLTQVGGDSYELKIVDFFE
jgi:hypothetical protein